MSTRHLVDPEILPTLDMFPPFELSAETLCAVRTMMATQMAGARSGPSEADDLTIAEKRIPGPKGDPEVRVLIYRPRSARQSLPALLHIHGGGYVIGAADQSAEFCKSAVREVGCVVVSVDYRLSPETPYPGGLEDCYAALKWLHGHAGEIGADAARIAIGGESAGGGLAAGLALLARDRGEVPIVFQLLVYPMLDDRTVVAPDPHPYTGEYLWTRANNQFGWSAYLGRAPGSPDVAAYAAAARAESVAGLPPAFINVGSLDLFLDENIDYAARLMRAGVPTELHVYPGAIHGFQMAVEANVTKEAQRDVMTALRRALHPRG